VSLGRLQGGRAGRDLHSQGGNACLSCDGYAQASTHEGKGAVARQDWSSVAGLQSHLKQKAGLCASKADTYGTKVVALLAEVLMNFMTTENVRM
jgi:hypothetical protein